MKVQNIRRNIPNSEIMDSLNYCIDRAKQVNNGEVIPELKTINSYMEEFAIVSNVDEMHDIVVIYSLQMDSCS